MLEEREKLAVLLHALADALKSMDSKDFDLLVNGRARIRIEKKDKRKVNAEKALDDVFPEELISDLTQQLNVVESREAAMTLLAGVNQPRRKNFLLLLAKHCNVHVEPKGNIATIERQIVENVVGARLNEQAIQRVAL